MGGLQEFLNTDQVCPLLNAFNAHCQIIDNAMEGPTLYNKCANLQTPCVNVLKLGKYQFQCSLYSAAKNLGDFSYLTHRLIAAH